MQVTHNLDSQRGQYNLTDRACHPGLEERGCGSGREKIPLRALAVGDAPDRIIWRALGYRPCVSLMWPLVPHLDACVHLAHHRMVDANGDIPEHLAGSETSFWHGQLTRP